MKRIVLGSIIVLIIYLAFPLQAADKKITAMTADTSPTGDDLVVTVNDPSGTPANRKVTLSNLGKGIGNVDAITGDSATAFFDAGAIETNYGGTGTDLSSTTGIMGINSGSYVDVDTAAELETYAGLGAFANEFLDDANAGAVRTTLSVPAIDDSALTGDPTITDATPTVTLQDSDDAAGTASILANSSGGSNDIILQIGVEDSTGEGTPYMEMDGVTETVDFLKPVTVGPISFNATADALTDDTYSALSITGLNAGEAITQWDCVYFDATAVEWMIADNTGIDTSTTPDRPKFCEAIATATGSNGNALTVVKRGVIRNDGWNWTEGLPVYLSTTGDYTQSRPYAATTFIQQVGFPVSDDELFFDPKPIDWGTTRVSTDADGETLTCIGATNTIWEETGATQDITLPQISECPSLSVTVIANNASAIDVDVNGADDTIVDGVANADGEKMTSTSTVGDQASCFVYDSDTIICQTNGWSLE